MPDPGYRAYVICTAPRSGSTLLCRLLADTGVAGQPGSHFHHPALEKWLDAYRLDRSQFATDRDAVCAVFDAARARGTGPNGIFALRLQRGSFTFFMEQARQLFPGRPSDVARFEAAFGPTLFVHLSRRNKLAQAISLVRAQQTGLWHRHANGEELERTAPPEPPHYDRAAIAAQLEEFAAFDTAWADWFAGEGVAPLRIDYDALIEAPRDVVASILEALSLDPSPADHVAVSTAKLADGVSAEWYAEFVRDARD